MNSGSNGRDIIWECKGNLQNNVKFGTTSISCEGYENSNDPFVFKDSCGVSFHIQLNCKLSKYLSIKLKFTLDYINAVGSGTGGGSMNIGGGASGDGGNINIGGSNFGGGGNINIGGFDRMCLFYLCRKINLNFI